LRQEQRDVSEHIVTTLQQQQQQQQQQGNAHCFHAFYRERPLQTWTTLSHDRAVAVAAVMIGDCVSEFVLHLAYILLRWIKRAAAIGRF
jgi:hypothetical protein